MLSYLVTPTKNFVPLPVAVRNPETRLRACHAVRCAALTAPGQRFHRTAQTSVPPRRRSPAAATCVRLLHLPLLPLHELLPRRVRAWLERVGQARVGERLVLVVATLSEDIIATEGGQITSVESEQCAGRCVGWYETGESGGGCVRV